MFPFFKWYIKKYRRIVLIKLNFYYKYRWEIFWEFWRIISTLEVILFHIDKIYFKYEKIKYWILYFLRKFFNIFKRKHFCYLYDTIRSDLQWPINYFDPRVDSSIKKKWYVYIWFLFKRFLKIWFWVYIIALKPLYLIKFICILIIWLILKYAFIVMDIIVMDIIVTDIINISVPYIYVRDIIKYVILDLPFYIIPNWIMWIFSFAGVWHMLKVIFIRIDTKLYDIQKHGYTRWVVKYRRMKSNYYSRKFKRNKRIFIKKKLGKLRRLNRRILWHNFYVKYSFLIAIKKKPLVSIGITFNFLRQFSYLAFIYISTCLKYNIKFIFGQILSGFKLWRYKIYNVYITIRCNSYNALKKNIFNFFNKLLNMFFMFLSRLKSKMFVRRVDNVSLDKKIEYSLKNMLFHLIKYRDVIDASSSDINYILFKYKFLIFMYELFVNMHGFLENIIIKNKNDTTIALSLLKLIVLLLDKIKFNIGLKKNKINIEDALMKAQAINPLNFEEKIDALVIKYKKDGLLSESYKVPNPFDFKVSDLKTINLKNEFKISDIKKDLKKSDFRTCDYKSKSLTASEIKSKFKIGNFRVNKSQIEDIKKNVLKKGDIEREFKISDFKFNDFKTGDIRINNSRAIFESVRSKSVNNMSKTSIFSTSNLYSLDLKKKESLIFDIGLSVDKDTIDNKWIVNIKFYKSKLFILVNKSKILLMKLFYGWKV